MFPNTITTTTSCKYKTQIGCIYQIKTVNYPNKYLKLLFNHPYFIILSDDYILFIVIRFSDNDNHGKYENTETR